MASGKDAKHPARARKPQAWGRAKPALLRPPDRQDHASVRHQVTRPGYIILWHFQVCCGPDHGHLIVTLATVSRVRTLLAWYLAQSGCLIFIE